MYMHLIERGKVAKQLNINTNGVNKKINIILCIWVIIKKWRNLCPFRFSRIRNFNFLVFLPIILNDVMYNMNKTLSNVPGDVV